MARELFMDASALYPLAVPGNADHERVAGVLRERRQDGFRFVTTNLVVAETHALLLHRVHRHGALAFLRQIARIAQLVVTSTPDLEDRAVRDWIERYHDHAFSLADAVSFAVMAERGIREAFALDRHFAAAGFTLVPASR